MKALLFLILHFYLFRCWQNHFDGRLGSAQGNFGLILVIGLCEASLISHFVFILAEFRRDNR